MMLKEIHDYVSDFTATGQLFEFAERTNSNGVTYREFVNAPQNLKDYFEFGYLHPETDWLVFNEERYTFQRNTSKSKKNSKCAI